MNILTAENITKSYSERILLNRVSFSLQEGEKVGIIGVNGTGKSTLLKLLAKLEETDEGSVVCAKNIVMRYLPQNPIFREDATVLESVVEAANGTQHTIFAKDAIGQKHVEEIWDIESQAKIFLTKLGMTNYEQKTKELSGGQKKRLALAAILLSPCDILLLDEPTNHIDHQMADWLEDYLKSFRGAIIMITHDRYFLDSVSNRIVEIDKGNLYNYNTNYSGFLEAKAQREEMEVATERKRQSILRTEREWMMRGARARSTKQKAHIQRYEELESQKGIIEDKKLELGSISSRMGRSTIEIKHISKSYGQKKLIVDFSYIFLKNDRIGFIGHNGCGKTTLMKMIEGRETPDTGEVEIGQTIKIGYYSQEIEEKKEADIAYMDPDLRVIDYIKNTAEYVRTKDGLISASVMLERFLFDANEQYGRIKTLSGGEKRRLNLLRVLMEAPNVLILDEPTNDLDIMTLSILEDYLDSYDGIVITVSHDRYFLDRIVKRIFSFEGNGQIRQYEGGYTDFSMRKQYEQKQQEKGTIASKKQSVGDETSESKDVRGHEKKLKFTYKEQKEYETIEQDIENLEEQIAHLDDEILKNSSDFVRLNELSNKKEETENELEEKMKRWEYLEDLAMQIEQSQQ